MCHIRDYLSELDEQEGALSEVDMCARFARHILGDLLGYDEGRWTINPHAGDEEAGEGTPDITISTQYADHSFNWIVSEAKLDDEEIRDDGSRAELWSDKRKYITADTVYFLWGAKRTVLVCDTVGDIKCGVYFDDDDSTPPDPNIISSTKDDEVREHLDLISAEQADSLAFLEEFRNGDLPYSYLELDRETIDTLTSTLRTITASLRAYLKRRWNTLSAEYAEYETNRERVKDQLDRSGDILPEHQRELRREHLKHEYAGARDLFEFAFPQFCEQQAYTKWEKEESSQAETEALVDIFCTDAAYVILGRLLFVRFAEDQHGPDDRPLIPSKISNGGLTLWRQLVGAEEPYIGRLVDLAFAQAGSIFEQVFSETPFDMLIDLHDEDFDRVLLLVLYKLNAFDFQQLDRDLLGDLYQKLLPRDMRKKLGEFYTDDEVVDYILHRSGFVQAARKGAPTILDPACGSGTFLVRAAYYLIEGARERGVSDERILELIEECIYGLDINDFAVFIARMNLLFTCFDLMINTRRDVVFEIHEANSLARPQQLVLIEDEGSSAATAMKSAAERVRDSQYDFVVGNPPYVRAERLPTGDREAIRNLYDDITTRNTDLSTYFVYRGMKWLEDGGTFGMIVPRGLTDAGYSQPLRDEFEVADPQTAEPVAQITELVPLDWVCHDLFDSDIVPLILLYEKREYDADATVSLVQGLRSTEALAAAGIGGPGEHLSELPWEKFSGVGPVEAWPLETTGDDFRVAEWLSDFPEAATAINTRYGTKLGAECHATQDPSAEQAPLLIGSDIYAHFTTSPTIFADISNAEDPSIWQNAIWDGTERSFSFENDGEGPPEEVVGVAEIGVTINAAVFSPYSVAARNSVILAWSSEDGATAFGLAAIFNSELLRWYSFVFLRASVLGGGRRDYNIYPRTLKALPLPRDFEQVGSDLAKAGRRVAEAAATASLLDEEVWTEIHGSVEPASIPAAWPVYWHDWPERYGLSKQSLLVERKAPDELQLSKGISISCEDGDVLDFLELHLPVVVEERGRITKQEAEQLAVPDLREVPSVLEQYENAIEERDRARENYVQLLGKIDEAVFDAFEMPDDLRQIVRRRMNEFPLSEYAAAYRRPWEPTRKPEIQTFEAGQRYE